MSNLFYPKMAFDSIKKNKVIYMPFIIMSTFLITMYFMMVSINKNSDVCNMKDVEIIHLLIGTGLWVLRIFAVIFMFYINSFLMKRRKKEFGLLNILGMEKRHISKMIFFETLYCFIISVALGIIFGLVFGKLMFLLLFKLIGSSSVPHFDVSAGTFGKLLIFFGILYFILFIYNIARVKFVNTIELLHSDQISEKEPKTKIIMTVIGFACIAGGYYFALTTDSPFKAVNYFLLAVVLVVIGTYAIFMAGSIAVLKLLRKNKKFYYKTGNFLNVSGMLYRMKQNAAGLASICILSTMVLISLSTTISLYVGMEKAVRNDCPNDFMFFSELENGNEDYEVIDDVKKYLDDQNISYNDFQSVHIVENMFQVTDGKNYELNNEIMSNGMGLNFDKYCFVTIVPIDEYNKLSGTSYSLNDNEVLLYTETKNNQGKDSIVFSLNGTDYNFNVKQNIDKIDSPFIKSYYQSIMNSTFIIVKDTSVMTELMNKMNEGSLYPVKMNYSIGFNTSLSESENVHLYDTIPEGFEKYAAGNYTFYVHNYYDGLLRMKEMYGGLLFIGIFVGTIFLIATIMIIYYKQISEGLSDCKRFEILQKVGMSQAEVKKTIKKQILMVFFIPLIVALIHVIVSFRLMKMMLLMLGLGYTGTFLTCTIVVFLIFAVVYAAVFMVTAKNYYKIVKFER